MKILVELKDLQGEMEGDGEMEGENCKCLMNFGGVMVGVICIYCKVGNVLIEMSFPHIRNIHKYKKDDNLPLCNLSFPQPEG